MSMNGLPVLPGPEVAEFAVGMPQPERRLALVDASAEHFELERRAQLTERRGVEAPHAQAVCRTPANVLPSSPNSPSNDGSRLTRIVSNQFGLMVLKLTPMSSIAKP